MVKAKAKAAEEALPPARESCIYRVYTPLCIRASGQWIPGTANEPVIADLSDVVDEMIHWLLEKGQIETADGEPINQPTGQVERRKPCPCRTKE